MKNILSLSCGILAVMILAVSCDKKTPDTPSPVTPDVKKVTITATLSDALTRVGFDPVFDAQGKPESLTLTWEEGDMLRIYDSADHSRYSDFTLDPTCAGTRIGAFEGEPIEADAYDISVISDPAFDFNHQTQPADKQTGDLKYMASATGIADYTNIEFGSYSSVLALTAKMPSTEVAAAIASVVITASEDIFDGGKNLALVITEPGDADEDGILHLFATLPAGNTAVPAGTTLLVKFFAPETEHTVYTRYIELGAQTFTANKCNTININASLSDKHAGLTSCDGTTAAKAYLVGDKYQLKAVNDYLVDGSTRYFKLIDDIDMKDESWTHINASTPYKPIDFDGNGKTIDNLGGDLFYVFLGSIRNLTLDHGTCNGTQRGILAQYVQQSNNVITNVDIKNGTVGSKESSGSNGGGLIGRINSTPSGNTAATITDCDVLNTSVKAPCAGGLLGSVESKVIVSNCSYSGNTVKGGTQKIGGLIGTVSDNIGCVISSCRVENATIDASGITGDSRTGGFVGQLGEGSQVKGCTVGTAAQKVNVKAGTSDANTNGQKINAGGFVGVNYGVITKDDSDNHCKAYVNLTSTNTYGTPINIGGFAGFQRGTITYSDAIVSMGSIAGQYIGGFAGYIVFQSGKTVLTDHCTVIGDNDSSTVDIKGNNFTGGFVGVAEKGALTISNCHVLEGTVVVGQSTAGGFAGLISSGTVEDCSANVTMQSRGGNTGGFAGAINGGTVQRCSSAGSLSRIENTNTTFGGFAGYLNGTDLTNCYSTVDISVASSYVGGLIGDLQTANTVSGCFYNGTISGPANTKGGLVATTGAVAATITNCYTAGELVGSSGTQIYGGIVGELKAGASVTNCYSVMNMVHGGRASGGIVGRACSAGWNVNSASNNTVSNCIAWNPNITYDGTASTSASSGAIIGYTSFLNILNSCYRRSDMNYLNSNTAAGTSCQTSMVDQVDSDGTNWTYSGTRPSGAVPAGTSASAQYQAPYYGVAAASGATVSSIAQSLGWSSDVWDFSDELPVLR